MTHLPGSESAKLVADFSACEVNGDVGYGDDGEDSEHRDRARDPRGTRSARSFAAAGRSIGIPAKSGNRVRSPGLRPGARVFPGGTRRVCDAGG